MWRIKFENEKNSKNSIYRIICFNNCVNYLHQKSDISDVPNQISVSSGNQISSTINMEEDLEWYDTLDEAKQDVSIIKKMKIMWHIDPRQRKLYKKNMKIG